MLLGMQWCIRCEPNDSTVVFYLNNNGGEGGEFIAPCEAQEKFHKRCVGFVCHSFGFLRYDGGEGGLVLLVQVYLLNIVLSTSFHTLGQVRNGADLHLYCLFGF